MPRLRRYTSGRELKEKVLGKGYPEILTSINNLVRVLSE